MPFNHRKKLPIAEVATPHRICWLCQHVVFECGEPGYSDYTPGSEFTLKCGEGYWEFDNFGDGLQEFREQLISAERCADFVQRSKS
jgi:hypothetical protein